MNQLNRMVMSLALCGICATASGFTMRVTVWRGESASVLVSDEFPEIGGAAEEGRGL